MKNVIIVVIFILLIASFASFVYAQGEKREKEVAYEAILAAKDHMSKMQAAGFSIKRVNDTILEAAILYEAQVALEEKTGSADYSKVIETANSVAEIRKEAFKVYDELSALSKRLEELSQSQNMSEAIEIFNEAKKEFEDERYEQTREAIDSCYKKINELQATLARIKAIYEASTKTLAGFFARNYKTLAIIALILITIYFFFGKKIRCYFINRAIRKLEIEKQTLNNLIKKAQYEYFQKGVISEGTYSIRVSKFGELIRDLNRRIPLLNVRIEEVKKRKERRVDSIEKLLHKIGLSKIKEEKEEKRKLNQEKERLRKEKLEEKKAEKVRLREEKKSAKQKREEEKKKEREKERGERERAKAEKKEKKEAEKKKLELEKKRKKQKSEEEKKLKKEDKIRRGELLMQRAEKLKREKLRKKEEEVAREKKEIAKKEEEAKRKELKEEKKLPKEEKIKKKKEEKAKRKEAARRRKEAKRRAKLRRKAEKLKKKEEERPEKARKKVAIVAKGKKKILTFLRSIGLAKTKQEKALIREAKGLKELQKQKEKQKKLAAKAKVKKRGEAKKEEKRESLKLKQKKKQIGKGELERKKAEKEEKAKLREEKKKARQKKKEGKKRERQKRKEEKKRKRAEEKLRRKEEAAKRKEEKARRKELEKQDRMKAKEKKEKEEQKGLGKIGFKKIKNYIQKTKSIGFSDKQIETKLAERGWPAELIRKAFGELEKE